MHQNTSEPDQDQGSFWCVFWQRPDCPSLESLGKRLTTKCMRPIHHQDSELTMSYPREYFFKLSPRKQRHSRYYPLRCSRLLLEWCPGMPRAKTQDEPLGHICSKVTLQYFGKFFPLSFLKLKNIKQSQFSWQMISNIRGICPWVSQTIKLERRMKWWTRGKTE